MTIETLMEISSKHNHRDFPKLMVYPETGLVVFFECPNAGMVVHVGISGHSIGQRSVLWEMTNFTDFVGTVRLVQK